MIRRVVLVLIVALAATASRAQDPAHFLAGSLTILDPWSRATPGGATIGAGYLVVENHGTEPDRLLRAGSELFAAGELHETSIHAGVARMRPTGSLGIAPNGRLELKPNGYHLMLTGLKRPLREGERFTATLVFEKAGPVPVTFVVRSMGANADQHDHH